MRLVGRTVFAAALLLSWSASAEETSLTVPIIVPITGLLALEGTSQLNGANLAIAHAPPGLKIKAQTVDSGTAAEGGANALERAVGDKNVDFAVAPLFGTQVLAMLPVALENKMPILAPTGTGPVTEQGNPYMFRLYPHDAISKAAHIRYVVDELKLKRAAILYNTTGYGQSGFKYMSDYLSKLGGEVVFSEGVDLTAKEISATLAKLKAAKPDVILIQMHSASIAMVIKQLAAGGVQIPVVGNTTIAMPATAALLQPSDLKGVCAESAWWLEKGANPMTDRFLDDYTSKFGAMPDAYAIQQYDGLMMALTAVKSGARSAEDVRRYMSTSEYQGVAMSYKSDGKGNLAHSVVIVCYDGSSLTPKLVKRYDDVVAY
ncbi:ABC transporter substrate-binding protein [Bradyrhizobium sp. Leo170]|uniref:ABC transporter substrate-binding protein n=1 Tax=Bradyrhizobium sp. Leo170 TaxID=1571199 RepID=UPI00102E852B|nr:ABC transporter substrate-binding protein [Bradyrhizobium sp. Leo170]TAI65589.1 amino acid ABC transporter substrate-binding protein [Bradyrhizobium sp. Leo170]